MSKQLMHPGSGQAYAEVRFGLNPDSRRVEIRWAGGGRLRRFVRDTRGRFTEVRHDPDAEEIMWHIHPAAPVPPRILSEDECRTRIERMKRDCTLPTFEEFHTVVEDVLDEIDAGRGDEPRERIFPRRTRRFQ